MKATFLLKSWFHGIFFDEREFLFFTQCASATAHSEVIMDFFSPKKYFVKSTL